MAGATVGVAALAEGAEDGRTPVAVNDVARTYILENMRFHLENVLKVIDALADGNSERAISAAKAFGTQASKENARRPKGMHASLPPDFVAEAEKFHAVFDVLAEGMTKGDNAAQSMRRLADGMQTCVSCHAFYKLKLIAN